MSIFDDVAPEAMSAVLLLVRALFRVLQAGDDRAKRDDALMRAAEDLKAEMDAQRFGRG